ncbi:hypothetical protein [Halomontanus rarus]|uniref:hypothetical protein n=1 Tax=Halomontanus rarus TaxID=3034020 RepID=UPI0023E89407|nr:hypothetical protein [Halovivax sp. TS33]
MNRTENDDVDRTGDTPRSRRLTVVVGPDQHQPNDTHSRPMTDTPTTTDGSHSRTTRRGVRGGIDR